MTETCVVTNIDYALGRIKAIIPHKNNRETNWIVLSDRDNDYPEINDSIQINFDNEDLTTGVYICKQFSEKNPPDITDKNIVYKKIGQDVVYEYNKSTKELKLNVSKLIIEGNLVVNGSIEADTITASGLISGNPVEGCVH